MKPIILQPAAHCSADKALKPQSDNNTVKLLLAADISEDILPSENMFTANNS